MSWLRRLKLEANLLKEGAVLGAIAASALFIFKENFATELVRSWFGPFTADSQLFWIMFYLGVTIGIIIDYLFVSPYEAGARRNFRRRR